MIVYDDFHASMGTALNLRPETFCRLSVRGGYSEYRSFHCLRRPCSGFPSAAKGLPRSSAVVLFSFSSHATHGEVE